MRAWADVKVRLRRKEETVDPVRRKVAKRLDRLPSSDVLEWADSVGSGVARALGDYRRDGAAESLAEARQGVLSLLGVLDVLDRRA